MRTRRTTAALALTAALAACGDEDRVYRASLGDGAYRVVAVVGFDPSEEARLLLATAELDRSNARFVLALADGPPQTLALSPRPPEAWQPDCFTTASHWENEVADLSPAPLQVESVSFTTPVLFAKCGSRMILADAPGEPSVGLAFDPL